MDKITHVVEERMEGDPRHHRWSEVDWVCSREAAQDSLEMMRDGNADLGLTGRLYRIRRLRPDERR